MVARTRPRAAGVGSPRRQQPSLKRTLRKRLRRTSTTRLAVGAALAIGHETVVDAHLVAILDQVALGLDVAGPVERFRPGEVDMRACSP